MNPVLQSIAQTLAFYDAVGGVPLTKIELYKYLINTETLPLDNRADLSLLTFGSFLRTLDSEWAFLNNYIGHKRGFYFLNKNTAAYTKRAEEGKTGIKKWRIAKRMAYLMSLLPYVRMIAITGSLALHTTNKNSDIDVLIIAKSGRIWTTRVLVSALMHILGKRRHGKMIRDRICLNHYIIDTEPVLRPTHLFSAHICATFMPIWDKNEIAKKIISKNALWAKAHFANFSKSKKVNINTQSNSSKFSLLIRALGEYILSKALSSWIEFVLRAIQTKKMNRKFIADNNALVFHHPRPKNQEALYLYRQNLKYLGLS